MNSDSLQSEREYLAKLLEAIQRCAFFLHQSEQKLDWPISGHFLEENKKDVGLFETLAAINERFAKLQDSLAASMRHAALLMSEPTDSFLKVLASFEKHNVITSIEDWQRSRTARNLAAHDYETDYEEIAEHFNALHEMSGMLYSTSRKLLALCEDNLDIKPASADFDAEFKDIE